MPWGGLRARRREAGHFGGSSPACPLLSAAASGMIETTRALFPTPAELEAMSSAAPERTEGEEAVDLVSHLLSKRSASYSRGAPGGFVQGWGDDADRRLSRDPVPLGFQTRRDPVQ